MYTNIMLVLILIDVQYLQNVVFGIEKGSNGQNHFLSDSHHLIKKSTTHENFQFPAVGGDWGDSSPLPLNAIWKTLLSNGGRRGEAPQKHF